MSRTINNLCSCFSYFIFLVVHVADKSSTMCTLPPCIFLLRILAGFYLLVFVDIYVLVSVFLSHAHFFVILDVTTIF